MKKILLILSYLRDSAEGVAKAIDLAHSMNAELVAFFVLDVEYAEKAMDKLTDEGWIGGRPSEQLYDSLLREYKVQAETRLATIREQAKIAGVPTRSIIKSGPTLSETLKLASLEEPDLIVVSRRKRSNLSRFIFGSLVAELKEQVDCEVMVIDAE